MKSTVGILAVWMFLCVMQIHDANSQGPTAPVPAPSSDPWPVLESPQAQASAPPNAPAAVAPAPAQAVPPTSSPGMAALYKASAANRYLFVFFHSGQNQQTDAMFAVLQSALAKVPGRGESVSVNITDPLDQEMVKGYGVDRAPMPLILVLAPNGAIMGGFPTKVEEAQLLGAFGTPGMEQTMKLLQDRRLVFVCVQNRTTQQNEAAMYGINELRADPQIGGAVFLVLVDPADPNEGRFLAQLQVDPNLNVAQTVMLAPPGAAMGKFMGGTTKTMLLSKLQASGGCGPGGCAGGKCGPAAGAPSAGAGAPQPQSKGIIAKVKSAFGR